MKILNVESTALPEVKAIEYARFADRRGYFTETFREEDVAKALSIPGLRVVQVNESFSHRGVVRGLHAQWNPYQGKLVRPIYGRLVDFAVDIRRGSPTFGQVVGVEVRSTMEDVTAHWVWIPPGFAHGVYFSGEGAIEYACTSAWSRGCEVSLDPQDPDLDWSPCDPALRDEILGALSGDAIRNEKDQSGLSIAAWLEDPRSDEFVHAPGEPFEVISRT